jgi:ABC-type sugar transport system substrate-binding protein
MKRLALLFLACTGIAFAGCASQPPHKIGFMPKLVNIPYFNACKRGAEQAAGELHLDLEYNGPSEADVKGQIRILDQWIASGEYVTIAVACADRDPIAPTLDKARARGLSVITYDADTQPDSRQFFVNQADYEEVAEAMADAMAKELEPPGTGEVAILTSSVSAPNQHEWATRLKAYVAKKYPEMKLLGETEHGENRDLGISKAKALIQAHPDLKGIIGLTSVAVPAAAEAVRQEHKKGKIKVTGVSTPRDMRDYLKDGTVRTVILWNPVDLGYLTVYVADLVRKNQVPENGTIQAGRLGKVTVRDREVLLGKPLVITKANVDGFDF